MIKLHDFSIGYGERTLLCEVETTIEKGRLTALIGRNGTGKSTLLRAIAGLNRRYTGRILLDGHNAADMRAAEMARTLAFVTTERTRIANLKCKDVVAIGRAPYTNWIGKMQEVDKVVSQVGKLVSQMTNLPAYAMAARAAGLTVKRFDLILAEAGSFILVVMLSDSSVKNKLIRLPVELTEQDLKLLGAVLNASVTELTADQLTPELLSRVTRSAGNAASLVPVIMDFVTTLLHQERSEVYMTGQAKLLGQPEYHDIDKAQKMLSALDEDVVSNLPAALSPDSRTQILVGPENVSKELRDTSVVMTKFDIGDGMQGMIGVLGPTRMDYAQITARLSYFAENLSRMFQKNQTPALEEPDNKHHDPEA